MIIIYDIVQDLLYLTNERYVLRGTGSIPFLGFKIWNFVPHKFKEEALKMTLWKMFVQVS